MVVVVVTILNFINKFVLLECVNHTHHTLEHFVSDTREEILFIQSIKIRMNINTELTIILIIIVPMLLLWIIQF